MTRRPVPAADVVEEDRRYGVGPAGEDRQYGLGRICWIWSAATIPMGLILWVVMPLLIPHLHVDPGLVYYPLITGGLVWQGVLSLLILRREVRPFTWAGVRRRLWLNTPVRPSTGRPSARLLWWTVPAIAFLYAWDALDVLGPLNDALVRVLPWLSPPDHGVIQNLAGPAKGQWWLLVVLVVAVVFNYLVGEELLFRGVLLPKMNGVFGRWDWIANGVLFSLYHVHMIWTVPSQLIVRDWVYPLVAKRFRSYWMSVVVHGFDAVFLVVVFPLAILGRL